MSTAMSQLFFFFLVLFGVINGSPTEQTSSPYCERFTSYHHPDPKNNGSYNYTHVHKLSDLDANKTAPGVTFYFQIKAPSNAHLRLAANSTDPNLDIVIVLGSHNDKTAEVRRRPKLPGQKDIVKTMNGTSILSDDEWKQFKLVLEGNNLSVYENRKTEPFLFYQESSVADLKYVSFSAWRNVTVRWALNCEAPQVFATSSEHNVNLGGNFTLNCSAHGIPEPKVKWTKTVMDKKTNKTEEVKKQHFSNNGTIATVTVTHATIDDSGTYTCTANSTAGQDQAEKTVTVIDMSVSASFYSPPAGFVYFILYALFIRAVQQ